MKRGLVMGVLAAPLSVLFAGFGYLIAWPVDVDPVAWIPPEDAGLVGTFAANERLGAAERVPLPAGLTGPEDVEADAEGNVYVGTAEGRILKYPADGSPPVTVAETGGHPLGLDWTPDGELLIADANVGLLKLGKGNILEVLVDTVDAQKLVFTDDLDVTSSGIVYFTDASVRFEQARWKMDIIENGPSGRLLAYDLNTGKSWTVLDGLYFANGVAISQDEQFLLVNETSRYRVRRVWLAGPKKGGHEVWVDNLPGFPDGISTGSDGLFWLALASPRNPVVDRTGPYPMMRKVMMRLPKWVQPAPERQGHAVGLDRSGRVVVDLQDPDGDVINVVTSVQERDGVLYFGSLVDEAFARISRNAVRLP